MRDLAGRVTAQPVVLSVGGGVLAGDLAVPEAAAAVVVFAHGSGSSRHSPRNRQVAAYLNGRGFATLLLDLLTADEGRLEERGGMLRFDIDLLGARVVDAVDWAGAHPLLRAMDIGLFGASTGAAAALVAAAARPARVGAVVSRGGRPDLAMGVIPQVRAPTLLIVGDRDTEVLALNRAAMRQHGGVCSVSVVAGATHLFEEPGALEAVEEMAGDWFERHLAAAPPT